MNHDDNDTIGNLDTIGSFPTQPEPERPAGPARAAPAETIGGLETQSEDGRIVLAGRYAVVKRLGEGGMGSVWLAEDRKLDGRKVAVKMLPAVLAGKKAAFKQVKAEALMAMKLSHPNIATVRGFEEDESGNPFLVMDYIEGQGLDDILSDKGTLSEEETVKLLSPVAAALDYAHAMKVVHRDVKPGNVMVDRNGTPFVLDFGIAREIQETMTRVTGKMSSGTLLYMSPEQLNGRSPKPAQDVYSFAAMAYECLTGNPPFSRGQIEWQIVNNPPEPLPEGVSAPLRQSVMAGLAKDPKDRPTSCAGVLGNGEKNEAIGIRSADIEKPGRDEWDARVSGTTCGADFWPKVRLIDGSEADGKEVPAGADACELGKSVVLPGGIRMPMVWCPPGIFLMGSPERECGRGDDETLHRVALTEGFWLAKYPVTQRQWRAVMGNNPSHFKGDNLPVENVNWEDCREFCRRTGLQLPTEAQWEYACRAGTSTVYCWGNTLNGDKANCNGAYPCGTIAKGPYKGMTTPVGSYAPNAWGLHDMHGNVGEWCNDWYGGYPPGGVTDPSGPATGCERVLRGGSWYYSARNCRSAYRGTLAPAYRSSYGGFRPCAPPGTA